MDEAKARARPEVAGVVRTPDLAQRVVLAMVRAVVAAKEQEERNNRSPSPGGRVAKLSTTTKAALIDTASCRIRDDKRPFGAAGRIMDQNDIYQEERPNWWLFRTRLKAGGIAYWKPYLWLHRRNTKPRKLTKANGEKMPVPRRHHLFQLKVGLLIREDSFKLLDISVLGWGMSCGVMITDVEGRE